jgi:hypothetical protein
MASATQYANGFETDAEKRAVPASASQSHVDQNHEQPLEPTILNTTDDAGPPDGGATAWLVVQGAWCCSFSSPGWMNSIFPPSSIPHVTFLQHDTHPVMYLFLIR